MEKDIKKRYQDILERGFRNDLLLYLFQSFMGAPPTSISTSNYACFSPTSDLIQDFISISQLSKITDLVKNSEIRVGDFDVFLVNWFKENKILRTELKSVFSTRFIPWLDFLDFYTSAPKYCIYCHITEDNISELISTGKVNTKRLFSRGRRLEIEKLDPFLNYSKGNLALSCYWCNNAKTDEFSAEEFTPIGEQIGVIWNERMKKNS